MKDRMKRKKQIIEYDIELEINVKRSVKKRDKRGIRKHGRMEG